MSDTLFTMQNSKKFDLRFFQLRARDSPSDTVQVFLPKRYSAVVSDDNMDKINKNAVSLNLVSRGDCGTSDSYLLAIET